ncbi:TonB-dependent receptor [Prosthecobacter sp.]|uniref:TonB-dependent receptor family protein n=1 Tax=Prosthecobacter sp. TaxID=1965333 RepID=UPI001DA5A248|nr:TonB-dependent receptor [Prosthecobacter sp.]MCB1277557.1 TonB-dependent receptor [Prosthecobacter sp.]
MKHLSPVTLERSVGPAMAAAALLFLAFASHARSQTLSNPVIKPKTANATELPNIVITADAPEDPPVIIPYLPPVEGTKIYAGKKATSLNLQTLPEVQANNYSQAFAMTPGLLTAEESTPLVSLGYRGIGSPDRAQYMMVLQDGIPIAADPQGYPESYWTPPLESTQRIDFVRGGASLLYGPQPAGALNYVSLMPRTDRLFGMHTKHIFGSNNLYSTFNSFDGSAGKWSWVGWFNYRSGEGFRAANSDFEVIAGRLKLIYQAATDTRWIFSLDAGSDRHSEPGGLTQAAYNADRNQTVRRSDRFNLTRYVASAELQHKLSEQTELSLKIWAGAYDRWSRRQTGGFGTVTALTNTIAQQQFYNWGIEPRIRHDYELWGGNHSLAAGMQFYMCHSPLTTATGASPTADTGTLTTDAQRDVIYGSFFLENKFTFGRLTITPGFRMELINQDVTVRNVAISAQRDNNKFDTQPLFGLGLSYDLGNETAVYANVSQSYRATTFGQTLVTTAGGTASDVAPSQGWNYEIGVRGNPRPWFAYDSSFFLIDLDDKLGTAGVNIQSVGRSINYGWDGAVQLDVIGALDAWNGTHRGDRLGSFNLYGNISLLEARLDGGVNDGGTPQYAPPYMIRTGAIYKRKSGLKIAFLGTLVARHYGNDTNTGNFVIPAYTTWDLTAEVPVCKNFSILAGLNNVFDKHYYSIVTSSGIIPAYGRNCYVGGSLKF